jgi:hypothetical protein
MPKRKHSATSERVFEGDIEMAKRAATEELETTIEETASDFGASNDVEESEPLAEGLIFEPGRVEGIDELRDAAEPFVTDYGADGEARDVPVTPPTPDNAQAKFALSQDREMHDGKVVREHRVAFGGRVDVSLGWPQERTFWENLRVGKTIQAVVNFEVGDDSYRKMTEDGVVIGLRRVRKLNGFSIHFAKAESDLDGLPMFEQANNIGDDPTALEQTLENAMCFCGHTYAAHFGDGTVRDSGPDEIAPAIQLLCDVCECRDFDLLEREVEPDYSGLSESLGIALEEPASDLCGKVHRGHADPCPFPAAECELEPVGA